jgi:predicted Zn-dependent protease
MTTIIALAVSVLTAIAIAVGLLTKRKGKMLKSNKDKELHWEPEHLPIAIVLDETLSLGWNDAVVQAIAFWNRSLGIDVFNFLGDVEEPAVFCSNSPGIVPVMPRLHDKHDAATFLRYDEDTGRIMSAPIFVDPNADQKLRYRVMAHELGHALGLAHFDAPVSVMFYKAMTGEFTLTNTERDLLKSWYG